MPPPCRPAPFAMRGSFGFFGTTSETSFSDQPAEPGDYWYRVFSIRDEERSTGSNVRKITYD